MLIILLKRFLSFSNFQRETTRSCAAGRRARTDRYTGKNRVGRKLRIERSAREACALSEINTAPTLYPKTRPRGKSLINFARR